MQRKAKIVSSPALSYYKLKESASILKSQLRARCKPRVRQKRGQHADSGYSARTVVLSLLITAAILLLANTAQAQRQMAATHIVRPGETLGMIAQSYGVDISTLAKANGISNAHVIHSWQELTIPSSASAQRNVPAARGRHIVRRGESLDSIAKIYGIDPRDLMALNKIYGWIYPGDELALPLPAGAAPVIDPAPVIAASDSSHIVGPGETLGSIAAAYGLSLRELQAANNIWSWIIHVGQKLTIPAAGDAVLTLDEPASPAETTPPEETIPSVESSGITHRVRSGETLAKIAAAYDVSLVDLQELNEIWTWIIYVGQELEIPAGGRPPEVSDIESESAAPVQKPAPATQPDTHIVQRGETLFRIAKTYGVDLDALMRANGIADATRIHSGLALRVRNLDAVVPPLSAAPSNPASPPAPMAEREQYIVRPGESLSRIGLKLGMSWLAIAEVNGLGNPDNLKVGAVLLIPTAEEAAKYGPVRPAYRHPGAQVGVGREFVVVLGAQMAYAYEDGVLKHSARISSGLPDTPTVKGDFKIKRKVRSQRMTGRDYDLDNVEWVMYFYAGYAFHGTWWHNSFGRPMSRGCVNMTNADAKWFYEFGAIGTPVHVRD